MSPGFGHRLSSGLCSRRARQVRTVSAGAPLCERRRGADRSRDSKSRSIRTRARTRTSGGSRRYLERADLVIEPLMFAGTVDKLEAFIEIERRRVSRGKGDCYVFCIFCGRGLIIFNGVFSGWRNRSIEEARVAVATRSEFIRS